MGFLDALRHAVSGGPNSRGRGAAERLNLKVIRLFEEGRFREATEAARQLLDVQRQELGEGHPDFATSLSNLALLLQQQGDLEGAEPLLRQALDLRTALLGESHPDRATTLNNLGELLSLRGDLEGAEARLREALAIRKELLGESHPDYATSLSSLALLLNKRGDTAGAESLLRQALDVRRQMLGELDPDYATGLSNLALLIFGRGDLAQAEDLLRQALEIRRAALGEHHPDSVATSNSLARLLRRRAEGPPPDAASAQAQSPGWDAGNPPAARDPSTGGGPPDPAILRPDRGIDELADEAARLRELFREVGGRVSEAGRRMGSDGQFPDPDTFRGLAVCHLRVSTLRAEVRELAASHGVPCPAPESNDGLREIDTLLDAVARVVAGESRARALGVLEQVLRLRSRDPGDSDLSALRECQANARELHGILSASPDSEPPPVVDQLAAGEHPFSCLLALIDRPDSLSPDRIDALERTVAWAFGRDLAESAAQARLFLATDTAASSPAAGPPDDPIDQDG